MKSRKIIVRIIDGYVDMDTLIILAKRNAGWKIIRVEEKGTCMDFICKHFDELTTTELYEILKTRFEIFVIEQECIYPDMDDKDQDAIHVFCWNDSGRVAACLRVFWKDGDKEAGIAQIGRVVTLEHGKGLGGKMLHEGVLIATERLKVKKIYLEAQEYAIGYYAKEGFEVVSDVFVEDGIPHVKMERVCE